MSARSGREPARLDPAESGQSAIRVWGLRQRYGEVDAVRGVNSEAVLDNLLERRMIRIAGRKESPGRPFLYETTREFLVAFGLRDLGDLPKVEGELVVPELAEAAAAQLADPGPEQEEIAAAPDSSEQDLGPGGDRVSSSG